MFWRTERNERENLRLYKIITAGTRIPSLELGSRIAVLNFSFTGIHWRLVQMQVVGPGLPEFLIQEVFAFLISIFPRATDAFGSRTTIRGPSI